MTRFASNFLRPLALATSVLLVACGEAPQQEQETASFDDAWLNDTDSQRTRDWVEAENRQTLDRLGADPRFETYRREAAVVMTDPSRLPEGRRIGDHVYNYWQDRAHPQGLWRRSPAESYFAGTPEWETVLDLDLLSQGDPGKSWFLAGTACRESRCLVSLADKSKDGHIVREFDLAAKSFVEDGFRLPESKSRVWWYDSERILVAPNLHDSEVNESELPRVIKLWQRGTPYSEAQTLYEGEVSDASIGAGFIRAAGLEGFVAMRGPQFFSREYWWVPLEGEAVPIPLPAQARIMGVHDGKLMLRLNQDWTPPGDSQPSFSIGSLIALSLEPLLAEQRVADAELLYRPAEDEAVRQVQTLDDRLYLRLIDTYRSAVVALSPADDGAGWNARRLDIGQDSFVQTMGSFEGRLWLREEAPLQPERLFFLDPDSGETKTVYSREPAFETAALRMELLETTSADGTPISYTVMYHENAPRDGSNPMLVYGYGGFDVAITPRYEPLFGKLWLEKGGVYVHAYLRGGGERGPAWHQSVMLKNRKHAYEDMAAVLEDLHSRGFSSPEHTGIMGRSNGGLMVSAVMVRRPELMDAVVVGGPLIDMLTYHELPPGASWTAEYGDPRDPELRDYIATYSPLQNLDPEADYPVPLVITSTYDDRVLPGHARRLVARMEAMGHEAIYFEDAHGGHYWELAGGPPPGDWRLRATARAVEYTYLARRLENDPPER